MRHRKLPTAMVSVGLLLIVGITIWLMSAQPVSAQCGSQASSCKDCHETQDQKPVNNDGTAWHTQHAFGDFCYLCHGGNNQATDKNDAHIGMVDPLSDIDASCKSCHPSDALQKAQIYATTLGVQVGTGGASTQLGATAATATPAPASQSASAPIATSEPVNSDDLVNYVEQYNATVLGHTPTNWGNVILVALIVLLLVGGGGFMIFNEKLVRVRFKVSFGGTRKLPDGHASEYPGDVLDMLPALTSLNPKARRSLKKILDKPEKTDKVLHLIDEVISDSKPEE